MMLTDESGEASAGPEEGRRSVGDRAGDCFRRYRDGHPESLGDLVDLATPILWQVARAHGCDRDTAQDVVQDVWLRLVDHADDIRETGAVLGWLVVSVKRDSWRLGRLSRRTVHDESGTVDPGIDASRRVPDGHGDPEALAILTERQEQLWTAVATLPERCRTLLRIVAFCDRPDYDEVSAALGMPRGSIGPTRGRCLDKLRRALADDPRWVDA